MTQYVSLDFPFAKLNWFNVNLQISLCYKFFMALNTRISDFLMDWFNMSIQMSLLFCFIFTEITRVLDIFMEWFIMSLFCNQVKKTPGALAHLPPCEERWDGPSDQTWEPVSICIHDNKQLYHIHTHFMFNTIFQPI